MQELVVCVVGLSNNQKEPFATRPGVGKSCLCFRFAYPGYDRYIDTHPSLFALHEFENPVINNVHFLYWGSPEKSYVIKGGDVKLRFHILENTVFYQDVTSHPFNSLTCPDSVKHYVKRITGSIESPGKHSYYSRDDICLNASRSYTKFQYPSNLTKQLRGYLVVFDVSLSGDDLEMQCKRVEPVIEYLYKTKKKLVIAATKRDCYKLMALEKAQELHKKYRIPLIEVSANDNLNVEEAFRVLAKLVLMKKAPGLSDNVQRYEDAAKYNLLRRGSAKRSFMSYVKKKCINCDDRLGTVEASEEYKDCAFWIGAHQTGHIFVQNALELYNIKVDSYAGVHEDPVMRQEFLEDYVDTRYDMRRYKSELRV